jgi:hypothetical protein
MPDSVTSGPASAHRPARAAALGAVVLALFVCLSGRTAHAQDAPAPQWQINLTPYLWIAGASGTVKTPNPNLPSQTVEAGFGDVLSHLDAVPVMGAAELRYGRFGLLTDIIAISVKSDVETNGILFAGGSVKLTQVIGTALAAYRVIEDGRQSLDLGIGVRAFGLSTTFALEPGLLPGFSVSRGADWATAIGGARYRFALDPTWSLTIYGDAGGGPNAALTWQVLGTLDYKISDAVTASLGFRHLQFEYEGRFLHQNMGMTGPILAGTVRF